MRADTVLVAIAVLAGMGLRTVLFNRNLFIKGLLFSITLMIIVSAHLFILKGKVDASLALKAGLFAGVLLILFQILLFLKDRGALNKKTVAVLLTILIFAELVLYIHRERPRRFDSFPKVPYIEGLRSSPERVRSYGIFWAFYPNTATGFAVDDLGYFFSLAPKRFVKFINTIVLKDHFRNDFRPPALRALPIEGKKHLLDLLNVKYIIAPEPERLKRMLLNFNNRKNEETNTVYAGETTIFQRDGYFPRTFIVHKAAVILEEDKALAVIDQLGPQLRNVAILHKRVDALIAEQLPGLPTTDNSSAEITEYSANRVTIKARMENPGFMVFSDAYHPDWRADVDRVPTEIFQTDYLLRSVFLPEGEHIVRFVFVPMWFYAGGLISLISLITLLGVWASKKG